MFFLSPAKRQHTAFAFNSAPLVNLIEVPGEITVIKVILAEIAMTIK